MNNYKMPIGFQDYLVGEAYQKNAVEDLLLNFYEQLGHSRIETPTMEYSDIFMSPNGLETLNELFKVSDFDGSLLCLRPDLTSGIARVMSTKLEADKISRLCYRGNSFNFKKSNNELREFTQVGIEVFGKSSLLADIDVISIAIKSMLMLGVEDFKIELGEVGYFKDFLKTLELSDDEKTKISAYIAKKDIYSIKDFIKENNLTKKDADFLHNLIYLFGNDAEVFKRAKKFATNNEIKKRVSYLEEVYKGLVNLGYADYIAIDFGLVSSFSYYTGIVFKGITKYLGTPILAGGRYDNLCKSTFKKHVPAVGFAIGINNVLKALSNQFGRGADNIIDFVIGHDKNALVEADKFQNQKIEEGYTVFNIHENTLSSFKRVAKRDFNNVKNFVYITKNGVQKIK